MGPGQHLDGAEQLAVGSHGPVVLAVDTSCDNGENLNLVDGATPVIDDTNDICEDTAAEAGE